MLRSQMLYPIELRAQIGRAGRLRLPDDRTMVPEGHWTLDVDSAPSDVSDLGRLHLEYDFGAEPGAREPGLRHDPEVSRVEVFQLRCARRS